MTKHSQGLLGLLLFAITYAVPANNSAADCLYCGNWTLFSGYPYKRLGQLVLTETHVTLPHCSPVMYRALRTETETTAFIEFDRKRHHPTKTYLKLLQPNNCTIDGVVLNASFALLRLDPPVPGSRRQLELSLVNADREPDGAANRSIGQWWFIREDYDPCQSTSGHGLWICAKLEKERMEERLESSISRLAENSSFGKDVMTAHKDWLEERRKACRTAGSGSEPAWAMMEIESCEIQKTRERTEAVTRLDKCIASRAQDCTSLRLPLTTRSRPTR